MTYSIPRNDPTFQRHDASGILANDFRYSYYAGTNRLRETGPFLEDIVYDGGRVLSNSKVYRSITVQGNSYVPAGEQVVLRATEKITLSPQFRAAAGRRFRARLVRDEDMYRYDAIGNLILDQAEGTKITWTPYGKVRTVSAQSDTVVTTFRYDGAGNRIEKRVVTNDTLVTITRYLRDAGGNVLAIYQDSTLQEQPIYGSARLGQYQGGACPACLTLGTRRYELSNHLDNVLTVITDNIGMSADTTWATVVSASDYYPFGLTMEGRNYQDSLYRYGFGGVEKDNETQTLNFKFREYNPAIGRFFSRDPKAGEFPWWTPYQYAGNRPIDGIDLEGAEYITYLVKVYDNGSGATIVDKVDYRGIENFNYEKYSESFGPEGRGVKFIYQYVNDAGQVVKTRTEWDVRQEGSGLSKSSLGRHGMYQGEGAKTLVGNKLFNVKTTGNSYDWGISPIDGVDAIAQTHDLDQEGIGTFNWLEDNRTLSGDLAAIKAWDNYVAEYDGTDNLDPFTGRKASSEAVTSAQTASIFFGILTRYKQWKIGEMERRGLDPNNVDDMKKVTIDDYKGKWYQFKRNAEQKILKSGSDAPK